MKPPRRKHLSKGLGSALVMTLVIIVLITVVTVGYLASVMLETKTAGAGLDQKRAYGIAMIGVHEAMSRVRDALGPWDDPYKNFATNAPPFYWSLSPGRITRWPYSSDSPTNFALFSESSGTNLVNLNRALADGSYPIIGQTNVGETNSPAVSVKWVKILRNPSETASSNNAIIGRYAFWVDDEGAKININTADGTEKYTTNSLGIGSPSEVSLEVLFGGTNGKVLSQEIVQIARTRGFHSPREILSATNVTLDVYTNNVFALTTYGRSPDLNVFGQPKMALLPVLGDALQEATNMAINGITMQALSEIYPTPSQLPSYVLTNPISANVSTVSWPLAFRQDYALMTPGRGTDLDISSFYTLNNYCYINGKLLAKYLSGTNAAGQPISWPVLPGSSTKGFAGKYTARQIDSIAAQICNLGARAISPDMPYVSDSSWGVLNWYMETKTDRSSAPVLFPGFLSGQWVSGMGRSPKVNRLLLKFTTYGSSGVLGDTNNPYVPPKASLDAWLEWWLPAAFRGGAALVAGTGEGVIVGHAFNRILNLADGYPSIEDTSLPDVPAILPRADGTVTSYWSDQLLRNFQGVDWRGNPPNRKDPDQAAALAYHSPYAFDSTNNHYVGTGANTSHPYNSSPLQMVELGSPNREWYPGEIRCVRNVFGAVRLPMITSATVLEIQGGIAVRGQMRYGAFSDPDPVPLEAIRGKYTRPDGVSPPMSMWTWEPYMALAKTPGNPSETVRERATNSVIPVNVRIPVPLYKLVPEPNASESRFVLAAVADPLVNKFPGDWDVSEVAGPPATMRTGLATTVEFGSYDEDDAWRASLADPDSYWMPQIDSLRYHGESPVIPRSARLPSIGYLQYLRTGIIPDDESVLYQNQHGTPFRLLSFAPSTEGRTGDPLVGQQTTLPSSQSYPDWAMLDLLYVPSTLTPFGGSYQASTNLNYYGTFGGATSGRINPNGSIIYTTNVNSPQSTVSRTLPLQAVVNGLKVNQTISGVGTSVALTGGADVDGVAISKAIEAYVRANGPLRLPGEVSNVPEVAGLRPAFNKTRNDLVRQIVGNLTTQGNVFSVWTAGQTLLKNKKNTSYGEFEPGDTVLAEVRLHFVVERYLDAGADGIYGNASNFGADGIVGTYDDPLDSVNHPFQPHYVYRVIASEEIR